MRLSLSILPLLVACGGATSDTAETDSLVDTAASDTSGDTDTATDTDPQDTATTTAWADVDAIFGSNCASCHYGEPAGLGFGDAYDRLVNTPSTQAPDLNRVTPGDLDGSYLWRKSRAPTSPRAALGPRCRSAPASPRTTSRRFAAGSSAGLRGSRPSRTRRAARTCVGHDATPGLAPRKTRAQGDWPPATAARPHESA